MEENKIYFIHKDKNILDVLFDKKLAEKTCIYINKDEEWSKAQITEITYEGIYNEENTSNVLLIVTQNDKPWKCVINNGIRQHELINTYQQFRDDYCVYGVKTLIM